MQQRTCSGGSLLSLTQTGRQRGQAPTLGELSPMQHADVSKLPPRPCRSNAGHAQAGFEPATFSAKGWPSSLAQACAGPQQPHSFMLCQPGKATGTRM